MSQKVLRWCLLIFLIADLSYSFVQHLNMPLEGDMAGGVVPDSNVERIFEDPFAISVITQDASYANPNRFFAHWTFYAYFRSVPFAFQLATDPVSSVYLACAFAKTIIQLLLILLFAAFVSGGFSFRRTEFLIPAALVCPLFQANGFCGVMGIIDPSITYTFFYALPLAWLMLFCFPLFRSEFHHKPFGIATKILLVPLTVFISLNGVLAPPVIIIITFLYVLHNMRTGGISALNRSTTSFLVLASVCSAYSLYVGLNNTILSADKLDVLTRYERLPGGLWRIFSNKLAFPLLLFVIGLNVFLIKKYGHNGNSKKLLRFCAYVGAGAVLYLLALPLAGYRSYRPDIIRHDTLLPVTLGLMMIYGLTSVFIIQNVQRKWFSGVVIAVSLIFMLADAPELGKNTEERLSFAEIAASPDSIVKVDRKCTILSWYPITDPKESKTNGQALYYWGITSEPKLYYQP